MGKPRYGNRTIASMRRNWNDLRDAVASGDTEAAQSAFDKCEEWVDFAFSRTTDDSKEAGQ